MNPYIEIAGRKIGYEFDPLIICEIGINHGGSLETAIEMVDAAKNAGAEIIKHQTHIAEDEMSKAAKSVIPAHTKESIYEIIDSCSLSEIEEIELQKYAQDQGLIFISTPFSRLAAQRLIKMNVPAFKIGSGECNNYPLIKFIAEQKKPVILSTGMNTIDSIGKSVEIFRKNNIQFALLHCTNVYPTPPELVRLNGMLELKKNFPDAVVGLSDHTITNYPSLGAIAMGASIIERHFTDSMKRSGPDISCSMDPTSLKNLLEGARILKKARGGFKGPVEAEKPTIDFAYASVVSIKEIKKGETFSMDNIWVKRPGNGEIMAEKFESIIGKEALKNISPDVQLRTSDIKNYVD
tara:strand:+ start:1354 stop:2406 length:1053 start_codon:yes stop_codon:yes gene_type:complete